MAEQFFSGENDYYLGKNTQKKYFSVFLLILTWLENIELKW